MCDFHFAIENSQLPNNKSPSGSSQISEESLVRSKIELSFFTVFPKSKWNIFSGRKKRSIWEEGGGGIESIISYLCAVFQCIRKSELNDLKNVFLFSV